jgi:copper chaperone CopZ
MRYEFTVKTNCPSCVGIIGVFIEKIPGVKSVKYDEETGKIATEYNGELTKEELAKVIEKKIGYKLE